MNHSPALASIILGVGLLFPVCGFAAETPNCRDPKTQLEMNACSYQSYKKADDALNRLYQQKVKVLQEDASKQRLKDAQKAWLAFRDASCLYEIGPREESGTIWPLLQNGCLEAFTTRRVAELKTYVACTKDGCPR